MTKVALYVTFDIPQEAEVKHEILIPVLDSLYDQVEIDGDMMHVIPTNDLDKVDTLIAGYNETYDIELSYELINID